MKAKMQKQFVHLTQLSLFCQKWRNEQKIDIVGKKKKKQLPEFAE